MSKQLDAKVTCRSCNKPQNVKLYRSLWIEDPDNRKMLFTDRVNFFECPICGHSERLEFPFLATNSRAKFAVWYEPYHDPAIDKDLEDYIRHLGENSYFATAPRISDWEYFKATIVDFETARNEAMVEFSDEIENGMNKFVEELSTQSKAKIQKPCVKIILLLSVLGPAIVSHYSASFQLVVILALIASSTLFICLRSLLIDAKNKAYGEGASYTAGPFLAALMIFVTLSAIVLCLQAAVYFAWDYVAGMW